MKKKKALVLINKTSGTGKAGNDTLEIVTKLAERGYEPVVYPILPGSGLTSETIIPEYEGQLDMILCSGGDGTLNHVMNQIMLLKEKPILAYIPSGSTNDFAKGLGIPSVRSKAIDIAVNGRPYTYDVGKMNDHYFNYVAAFGAFSKVSYATDQELKNVLGYAAYVLSAMAEIPQSLGYSCHMKIEADGLMEEGDYIFGAVSNSASVAGMTLFADTDIKQDDGQMELLLIRAPKNLAEFNAIIAALATKEPDNPYLTYKQVKNVKLVSDEKIEWTLDGEFGGAFKKTTIEVVNKAVSIMVK
ncbi:lipid kinase, YegS/Rv2252/BmrU family [Butyrivibrio hungatei DSM 14810]|uniref:Lipid kinase, YegS/Rv2252/BmrU family n=1 Tax=Butyrivibrio hungatei DSM 14810 TaxID=1121132 RepID=A0A1M7RW10_9FIRM|nr:YegS/Rv2252/BmrU family lipid kinase [Butyrivibrio hungatei]SHN50308.1 lipid kinase, YegS/Rv2252/BmrU family [Butyrivibrio hungatei DSM 14810]